MFFQKTKKKRLAALVFVTKVDPLTVGIFNQTYDV